LSEFVHIRIIQSFCRAEREVKSMGNEREVLGQQIQFALFLAAWVKEMIHGDLQEIHTLLFQKQIALEWMTVTQPGAERRKRFDPRGIGRMVICEFWLHSAQSPPHPPQPPP